MVYSSVTEGSIEFTCTHNNPKCCCWCNNHKKVSEAHMMCAWCSCFKIIRCMSWTKSPLYCPWYKKSYTFDWSSCQPCTHELLSLMQNSYKSEWGAHDVGVCSCSHTPHHNMLVTWDLSPSYYPCYKKSCTFDWLSCQPCSCNCPSSLLIKYYNTIIMLVLLLPILQKILQLLGNHAKSVNIQ